MFAASSDPRWYLPPVAVIPVPQECRGHRPLDGRSQLLERPDLLILARQPQDPSQLAFAEVALPVVEQAGQVIHDRGGQVEGCS